MTDPIFRVLPSLDEVNAFFWTSGEDGTLRFLRCSAGISGPFQWSLPFRAYSAANWLAMNAQRHFHEFGTTREQRSRSSRAAGDRSQV